MYFNKYSTYLYTTLDKYLNLLRVDFNLLSYFFFYKPFSANFFSYIYKNSLYMLPIKKCIEIEHV